MKGLLGCAILLMACCGVALVRGDCKYQDHTLTVGDHPSPQGCLWITCKDDGIVTGVGCALWQCAKGKQIGYREGDHSKPYPDCCEGPICKD